LMRGRCGHGATVAKCAECARHRRGTRLCAMRERPIDAIERDHLCDLFLKLGPDAPTLCEGWTALDLAAHLVVREHDPRAGLAILGGERFSGLERRLLDGAEKRGFDALVARLGGGPP